MRPRAWRTCTNASGRASFLACPRRRFGPTASNSASTRVIKDAGIQPAHPGRLPQPVSPLHDPAVHARDGRRFYLRDRERWGKIAAVFSHAGAVPRGRRLAAGGRRSRSTWLPATATARRSSRRSATADSTCWQLHDAVGRIRLSGVENGLLPAVVQGRDRADGRPRAAASMPRCRSSRSCSARKRAWPFLRTATPAVQFIWGGGDWRSLQVNPFINQVNGRALQAWRRST